MRTRTSISNGDPLSTKGKTSELLRPLRCFGQTESGINNPKHSISPSLIKAKLLEMSLISQQGNDQQDSNQQGNTGEIFCYTTMYPENDNHSTKYQHPLYAYKVSADPDTLYLHQVMK